MGRSRGNLNFSVGRNDVPNHVPNQPSCGGFSRWFSGILRVLTAKLHQLLTAKLHQFRSVKFPKLLHVPFRLGLPYRLPI